MTIAMTPGWSGRERALAVLLAALVGAYVCGALLIYPSIFPDPSYGLLVHKSMRAGAPWNHMTEPSAANIAADDTYFYATWSPGQYAVPGVLMDAGLTPGDAARIVNVASALIGLAGWYGLLTALGFERAIALTTILLIAASRTVAVSFLIYTGSDQLAFASFPFLARLVLAARERQSFIVVAPLAIIAGFFLKNSMAIYMTAWTAVLAVATLIERNASRAVLARMVMAALAVIAALGVIHIGYVTRGWTPVDYQPVLSVRPATYVLPTAMITLAGTGIDDVLSRIFDNPVNLSRNYDYKSALPFLLAVVVLQAAWWLRVRPQPEDRFRRTVVVGYALTIAVAFTILLATGSEASLYLSRHYLIPGFLILALLLADVARSRLVWLRLGVAGVLMLTALYGVLSFGANWRRHHAIRAVHSDAVRITQTSMTPASLGFLRALNRDLPATGTLVVVPIPSLALELPRLRVLARSIASLGAEDLSRHEWKGRVDNMVVVVERAGQSHEAVSAWLRAFTSYDADRWSSIDVDGFAFYVPGGQPVDRQQLAAILSSEE